MAVTLEFQQWWEVELPAGVLRGIADEFTAQTGIEIQLLSNPYADTNTQIAAGAATGTMADVVGLDGAWVYDYAKQGAILQSQRPDGKRGYNDAQLSDQIKSGWRNLHDSRGELRLPHARERRPPERGWRNRDAEDLV